MVSWKRLHQNRIDSAQGSDTTVADLKYIHQLSGAKTMSKERNSKKAEKKKPAMTTKEKKAAKKSKKESKTFMTKE